MGHHINVGCAQRVYHHSFMPRDEMHGQSLDGMKEKEEKKKEQKGRMEVVMDSTRHRDES